MEDFLARNIRQLLDRAGGPLHLRFIVQPVMVTILAIRAGMRDAGQDRQPYLWAVFFKAASRRDLVREAWRDIAKVFIISVILDTVYQVIELQWLYPLQAVIVATVLAIVPYVLIRGPASRLGRRLKAGRNATRRAISDP